MNAIQEAIDRKLSVKIYTTNGYQMCGVIVNEESNYIVLRVGTNKKIVFKHAISTIEAA